MQLFTVIMWYYYLWEFLLKKPRYRCAALSELQPRVPGQYVVLGVDSIYELGYAGWIQFSVYELLVIVPLGIYQFSVEALREIQRFATVEMRHYLLAQHCMVGEAEVIVAAVFGAEPTYSAPLLVH